MVKIYINNKDNQLIEFEQSENVTRDDLISSLKKTSSFCTLKKYSTNLNIEKEDNAILQSGEFVVISTNADDTKGKYSGTGFISLSGGVFIRLYSLNKQQESTGLSISLIIPANISEETVISFLNEEYWNNLLKQHKIKDVLQCDLIFPQNKTKLKTLKSSIKFLSSLADKANVDIHIKHALMPEDANDVNNLVINHKTSSIILGNEKEILNLVGPTFKENPERELICYFNCHKDLYRLNKSINLVFDNRLDINSKIFVKLNQEILNELENNNYSNDKKVKSLYDQINTNTNSIEILAGKFEEEKILMNLIRYSIKSGLDIHLVEYYLMYIKNELEAENKKGSNMLDHSLNTCKRYMKELGIIDVDGRHKKELSTFKQEVKELESSYVLQKTKIKYINLLKKPLDKVTEEVKSEIEKYVEELATEIDNIDSTHYIYIFTTLKLCFSVKGLLLLRKEATTTSPDSVKEKLTLKNLKLSEESIELIEHVKRFNRTPKQKLNLFNNNEKEIIFRNYYAAINCVLEEFISIEVRSANAKTEIARSNQNKFDLFIKQVLNFIKHDMPSEIKTKLYINFAQEYKMAGNFNRLDYILDLLKVAINDLRTQRFTLPLSFNIAYLNLLSLEIKCSKYRLKIGDKIRRLHAKKDSKTLEREILNAFFNDREGGLNNIFSNNCLQHVKQFSINLNFIMAA